MTLNTFFQNFSFFGEQQLLQDLGTEMIQRYGVEVYYLPRSHVNIDNVFLEDALSEFTQAVTIEVYIKTFQGWQGEGDLMQKFGISMADQITLSMMRRRWYEEFTIYQQNLIRPLEGDFVYLPLTKALFEVKFVEHESNFYQTGQLSFYDIKCERVNYSSEKIQTGVPEVDDIASKFSNAADDYFMLDEDGDSLQAGDGSDLVQGQFEMDKIDSTTQNSIFSQEGKNFIDFSRKNPFGEII
jgi:hypothetical protein